MLNVLRGDDGAAAANVAISNTPLPFTVADDARVGGWTNKEQTSLTVSGGAFVANDCVGGKFSLALFRASTGTGIIHAVTVLDLDNQKVALDVFFFDSDPSASTFTNNTAVSLNSADRAKIIGKASIGAGDYANIASGIAVATVSNVGIPVDSGATVYVAIVTQATPTYTTGTMIVTVGALQD